MNMNKNPRPNNSVQATAAAPFRFVALLVFTRPFCRPWSLSVAVPDLYRSRADLNRELSNSGV